MSIGLVLLYNERSDLKGQRITAVKGQGGASDAAMVSGCFPPFVCIISLFHFCFIHWLGHVREISSATWELGF